ncbi:MAG: glycosyltransferase family 4 protein [Candidatus Omnitrophica bacterium]|nr:glycosyltransferase family 4 protein [Candidatus Omnitrophota bacterium]
MKKIKVLRIIARLNIGGPAIHTILLLEGLDKAKFESVLVTGKTGRAEGDMLYLAQEKGVQPVIIPELGRDLNIFNDFIAFWKIFNLIRRQRPDIVHTHTAKAGTLGRLAGLLYKILFGLQPAGRRLKLVHTFHGHVLHSYFNRTKTAIFVIIERFLALFTDRIIAVSERVKEDLLSFKIATPEKIVTVRLGLELEKYLKIEKSEQAAGDNCRSIGIVGRLVPVKNHQMFLDVAKRIKNEFNGREKIRFLVVGDGPLRGELENYTRKLGIMQDVDFTGWIKDLARIYSELDIAVLTSLNEGTPVALIEAQAACCPCVATTVGGAADVIEDGKSGFLVPSQDSERLFQAIVDLLNDPKKMREMGRFGRDRVRDKFDKKRLIRDIESLYLQELVYRKDSP